MSYDIFTRSPLMLGVGVHFLVGKCLLGAIACVVVTRVFRPESNVRHCGQCVFVGRHPLRRLDELFCWAYLEGRHLSCKSCYVDWTNLLVKNDRKKNSFGSK